MRRCLPVRGRSRHPRQVPLVRPRGGRHRPGPRRGQFPTSRAGLARAADWIGRRTGEDRDSQCWLSCEGTGSYGARLAKTLLARLGYRVVDAPSPKRERGRDKNDTIDAIKAARSALRKRARPARRRPRRGAPRRPEGAAGRPGPDDQGVHPLDQRPDRAAAHRTTSASTPAASSPGPDPPDRRLAHPHESPATAIARAEAVRLAARIGQLHASSTREQDPAAADRRAQAPVLLEIYGVGPVNAAIVLSVWSHPGRIHHEAALARTRRRIPDQDRLRRLAPSTGSTAAATDNSTEPCTRSPRPAWNATPHPAPTSQRRTQQGLSKRRIRRCLKRYIARQLFRTLTSTHTQQTNAQAMSPAA